MPGMIWHGITQILVNLANKLVVTTMLAGKAMQSKLINLSEIINNNISLENKDHIHRKP